MMSEGGRPVIARLAPPGTFLPSLVDLRSSRSVRTGPGSRGGAGHTTRERLAIRPDYFRAWRRAHPAYMERERRRGLRNKAFARLARVLAA